MDTSVTWLKRHTQCTQTNCMFKMHTRTSQVVLDFPLRVLLRVKQAYQENEVVVGIKIRKCSSSCCKEGKKKQTKNYHFIN